MQRGEITLGSEPDFRLGRLAVRPSASEVAWEGGAVRIEPRAMQVLAALARAETAVVTRDELIRTCWGGNIVGDDAINRVVGRLRKLSVETAAGFVIETIPKIGYRLLPPAADEMVETAPVSAHILAPEAAQPTAATGALASGPAVATSTSSGLPPHKPLTFLVGKLTAGRRWKVAAATAVALAALGAIAIIGLAGSPKDGADRAIVVSRPVTLAVLPFDSFAGDEKSVQFADGLSGELHHALARSGPGPQLIGRASSSIFRGDAKRIEEMRNKLGVTHIVDGTVERKGDRITASVELVDAVSGRKIWSDRMTADLADIEMVLHRIVVRVRDGLDVEAGQGGSGRQIDPRALDLYFSTEYRQGDAYGEEQRAAIQAMKTAVTIEPNFTRAWARLLDACVQARWYAPTLEQREEARATGREASKTLVRLAGDDPETWLNLARLEDDAAIVRDYEKRAEALDPDNPYILLRKSYGFSRHGKGRQALEMIERARVLNPLEERMLWALFKALAVAGQAAQTEAMLEETPPDIAVNVWPSVIMDWLARGDAERAKAGMRRFAEAVAAIERRTDVPPGIVLLSRRWSDEFLELAAALNGGPAARAALAARLETRVLRLEGQFDERGAVYRQYLPMIALLSSVDRAMEIWSKRMDGVGRGASPAEAQSQRILEFNAWATMGYNSGFRQLHRDPRFWRMAARYSSIVDGSLSLTAWIADEELWAPDFCGEPGFPYDCVKAAREAAGG